METASLYRIYAKRAKTDGYLQIADILRVTADNELAHAELLTELLHQCALPSTAENLDAAAAREKNTPYKKYADEADEDGFPGTADLFRRLCGIEENHARRFAILSENLQIGEVFYKEKECYWLCRICGGVQYGKYAPQICPVCGYPQSVFSLYTEDY